MKPAAAMQPAVLPRARGRLTSESPADTESGVATRRKPETSATVGPNNTRPEEATFAVTGTAIVTIVSLEVAEPGHERVVGRGSRVVGPSASRQIESKSAGPDRQTGSRSGANRELAHDQSARQHRGAAGIIIRTGEHDGPGAVLDQSARARQVGADRAVEDGSGAAGEGAVGQRCRR